MIDIIERPSETGKIIHLNPQEWDSHQKIHDALNSEKYVTASCVQHDAPRQYPAGTVAEIRRSGSSFISMSSSRTMVAGGRSPHRSSITETYPWKAAASSTPPSASSTTQITIRASPNEESSTMNIIQIHTLLFDS